MSDSTKKTPTPPPVNQVLIRGDNFGLLVRGLPTNLTKKLAPAFLDVAYYIRERLGYPPVELTYNPATYESTMLIRIDPRLRRPEPPKPSGLVRPDGSPLDAPTRLPGPAEPRATKETSHVEEEAPNDSAADQEGSDDNSQVDADEAAS